MLLNRDNRRSFDLDRANGLTQAIVGQMDSRPYTEIDDQLNQVTLQQHMAMLRNGYHFDS